MSWRRLYTVTLLILVTALSFFGWHLTSASAPESPRPVAVAPATAPATAPGTALSVAPGGATTPVAGGAPASARPGSGAGPTSTTRPSATAASRGQTARDTAIAGFMNYTVRSGDSLDSLARRLGTTEAVIARASGIPVSQILYPGMSLRVPTADPAKVQPPLKAVAIPWSKVNEMWKVGTVAQVIDVRTGNTFYVMRYGGWAHADSEPVSARDTAIMLGDYGGEWSWARRPIVVVINGQRIAASQNGMPHGTKSLKNNGFPGHFCIHFLGSTTHGSIYTVNRTPTLDPAHQRAVQEAVGH